MSDYIIEGSISVKAVLAAGSRPMSEIYLNGAKESADIKFICALAKEKGVFVKRLSGAEFAGIAPGKTNGGVAASVGDRQAAEIEPLLHQPNRFIVFLEGVEDPYILGDCLRSLYAAGADGVILCRHTPLVSAAVIIRASAGASEFLEIAIAQDTESTLAAAKERGFSIICADRKDASPLFETRLKRPLLVAIGGSLRGLSSVFNRYADDRIYIPYGSGFRNSLSAGAACSVIGFEVLRQERF